MTLYVTNLKAKHSLVTSFLFFDLYTGKYIRVHPHMTFLYLAPLNNESIDQVIKASGHGKNAAKNIKLIFSKNSFGTKKLFLYTFGSGNGIVILDDEDLNQEFFEKLEYS